MAKPILTLTTDFGLSDHYVGAMKGVILGICPRTQIVDISHEVTPFAVAEGAYLIAQAYGCFPPKTVHVVVVDPGVGTSRRPILAEAAGQFFIAPDNGVLGMIFSREQHKVRVISNEEYFRKPVSQTFHGRDIFAPVAAHIAAGAAVSTVGAAIDDYARPSFDAPERAADRAWTGSVLHIDRFGNIVTNFGAGQWPDLGSTPFSLTIGAVQVTAFARNYAERAPGELFVIPGSAGYLEVSVGNGSAAKLIGVKPGASVNLVR